MPVKNAAKWLTECLDSILAQSETGWELIAIDDHSADDSVLILRSYQDLDTRIRVYENRGEGIIQALRMALSLSSGELIHRMDADDIMPEYKLERLKNKWFESGSGNVVTGKVQYFSDSEISAGYKDYEKWMNSLVDEKSHWKNIYRECVIASANWLLHKDDLLKCGAFYPDLYPEDYDLVFRFFESGLSVVSINEVLHLWREHPERTSRNHFHYEQESFFRLRVHYFLKLHHKKERELIILGSGLKGKMVSSFLNTCGISHKWLGKNKHDQNLQVIEDLIRPENQFVILFSESSAQQKMIDLFNQNGLKENRDYFFFR
jgi:glycosyltransferase involved in cell wall biosynthesis